MTNLEQAALTKDIEFRDRIKISLLHYSDYIAGEATNTPAHNTRLKFSTDVYENPDQVAAKLQPSVVMDAKVQEQGAAISDADLQTSVESTVNKRM